MSTAIEATMPPYTRERADLVRLGLWMFLGTVTMLFAAFTSAYVVRRSGADWQPLSLPPILHLNTITLVAGSLALEGGRRLGMSGRWSAAGAAHSAALVLTLVFLGGQVAAWRQLAAAGVYLPTNPSSSFFFMLTGAHAAHVVAAAAVVAWSVYVTWTVGGRDPVRWLTAADVSRLFSHFLLGVWVYLLALVTVY